MPTFIETKLFTLYAKNFSDNNSTAALKKIKATIDD